MRSMEAGKAHLPATSSIDRAAGPYDRRGLAGVPVLGKHGHSDDVAGTDHADLVVARQALEGAIRFEVGAFIS
jgi:hypothetical protein